MARSLLSYDIASIQRYVFATDGLREIRGASALVDRLNRDILAERVRAKDPSAEEIFAGGGSGLLEVDSARVGEADAALQKACREETESAALHTAHVEYAPGSPGRFPEAFRTLHAKLRLAKSKTPEWVSLPSHSLIRTCDCCGDFYASEDDPDQKPGQRTDMVCRACALKVAEDHQIKKRFAVSRKTLPGLWGRIARHLPEDVSFADYKRPREIDDLTGDRDLALLYADGDGMSDLFGACSSTADVQTKSRGVEQALLLATAQGLGDILRGYEGEYLPFDVLLLGGDDLVIAVQAQYAFRLAIDLLRTFPAEGLRLTGHALSLSVGIAVAHPHYPIRALLDLSHGGALRYAKRERYLRSLRGDMAGQGIINHIVVGNLSHTDFSAYMKEELTGQTDTGVRIRRTLRPYTAAELENLLDVCRTLRQLPRTKLEALRATAFMTRNQGTLEGLGALARLRDSLRTEVLQSFSRLSAGETAGFPWFERDRQLVNPWADIAELADYASGKDRREV